MAKRKAARPARPLKAGEGGAQQAENKKRARFPTPDEMDVMDDMLKADQAFPPQAIAEWRKMRQLANRMKFFENRGFHHPAWDTAIVTADPKTVSNPDGVEIDPMTCEEFCAMIEPPEGTTWKDFGTTWDVGPQVLDDGTYEPVMRHRSIASQWAETVAAQALTITPGG